MGGQWREDVEGLLPRVPIILTAQGVSCLYAPLLRDGRMDKFFWQPSREDMVGFLRATFSDETGTNSAGGSSRGGGGGGLSAAECDALLDAFPEQAGDCGFFMQLKSRVMDEAARLHLENTLFKIR